MKIIFNEYHKFSDNEFKELFKKCLFVFDTNTLLNMYRYKRDTFTSYIEVLNELKNKKQLWIPYQVGYEFYENRINVISEFESSYDELLDIFNKFKNDIKSKYKNHPFLDLGLIESEVDKNLTNTISKIKSKKKSHPNWFENDDVLEKLNELFIGNIGKEYNFTEIDKISKEGELRYSKKIPPGFKDNNKCDEKKYGDLILWKQIIDKAKEVKKPIIFISGDVKEDWWLVKNGKRIMPLPQLKKEIKDNAGVDFHIYTADKFLEIYSKGKKGIDSVISDVRKIRESNDEIIFRNFYHHNSYDDGDINSKFNNDYLKIYNLLKEIYFEIKFLNISKTDFQDIEEIFNSIRGLRVKYSNPRIYSMYHSKIYNYIKLFIHLINKFINKNDIDIEKIFIIQSKIYDIERYLLKLRVNKKED